METKTKTMEEKFKELTHQLVSVPERSHARGIIIELYEMLSPLDTSRQETFRTLVSWVFENRDDRADINFRFECMKRAGDYDSLESVAIPMYESVNAELQRLGF